MTTLAIAVPVLIIGSLADLLIIWAVVWGIMYEYRKQVIKMQTRIKIRKQARPRPSEREIDTRTPSGRRLPY